jgi:hypothetical protein
MESNEALDITCVLLIVPALSNAERMMMTVSEIVRHLIEAHDSGKDVNLNK